MTAPRETSRPPGRELAPSPPALHELLQKYDLLLALSATAPGRTTARRESMRQIAVRFPGALREWEELPPSELARRRDHVAALLAAVERGDAPSAAEPWLRYTLLLHAELRRLMQLRRLHDECRRAGATTEESCLQAVRLRWVDSGERPDGWLTTERLAAIAFRPGGRLSDLAYAAIAAACGVSIDAIKQAIFSVAEEGEAAT